MYSYLRSRLSFYVKVSRSVAILRSRAQPSASFFSFSRSFWGHAIYSVGLVGEACLPLESSSVLFFLAAAVPFVIGFCHRLSIRNGSAVCCSFGTLVSQHTGVLETLFDSDQSPFLSGSLPRRLCR